MTDTKPTIDEQIEWIQSDVKAHENYGHILASLKELKRIKEQPVPVEPDEVTTLIDGSWSELNAAAIEKMKLP